MKLLSKWFALVLVVLAVALMSGCGRPQMVEDDSDLPWAQPEDWEGTPSIGIGM